MEKLKYMKSGDVKTLRNKLVKENNNICPVLKVECTEDDFVLDHIHASARTGLGGENSFGCIRNSITREVNIIEGKIVNAAERTGLNNKIKRLNEEGIDISLPQILRNLADYLEKGAYVDKNGYKYVHPSEVPKPKKVQKSSYDKLVKELKKIEFNNKIPEYPKSGTLTQALEKLYKLVDLEPIYYA